MLVPSRPVETVTLDFGTEELVYVNSGVAVHCPADADRGGKPSDGFFRKLTDAQAAALFALIGCGAQTSADAAGQMRRAA
jgi:hypothetical protein